MAYSVPLGVLVGSLVLMVLVLLLVLRSRKKRRTRRLTAHMQSPTLKEVSLLTKEGELGLLFPNSPLSPHHGNTSPSDPLEFPRSRLYIYHNKVLGELHTVYQGLGLGHCVHSRQVSSPTMAWEQARKPAEACSTMCLLLHTMADLREP